MKPNTDERYLDALRLSPGTIRGLADTMCVTATAVRTHLLRLIAAGKVERVVERHGRGRPRYLYKLTDAASGTDSEDRHDAG
jgi:predicted ArsR family transcriptional regulator